MPIKHSKVLLKPDNGNSGQIQSDDWNGDHVLTGMLALLDALSGQASKVMTFDASGNPELLPKNQILSGASPAFSGTPTAPTASQATNNDQIATTAFVKTAVAALVTGAPALLDTLDELAAALGDDANFAATMTALLALKAPLASPTFTGNPIVPDQSALDNSGRVANTKYVDAAAPAAVASARASLASLCQSLTNPSAASTSNVMMGFGVSQARITPQTSKLDVTIDGSIIVTAGATGTMGLRYGTGSGPANGAAASGTLVGSAVSIITNGYQPEFSVRRIITGLTPGTPVWVDLALQSTSGNITIFNCTATARDF